MEERQDLRYQILTNDLTEDITVSRFPHEEEQEFIYFVAPQYRATKIIRLSDGIIVYERTK